ncbi:hypothetical protein IDJ77_15070 [Mucilaginibacter sp. ZT4R22]|uniref:Uncharacterized protein n=1 Tax=Mucilaginibacter pankratovii TaxID=2772110 RepID=A0ABR7WSB3_9SPHI|nr:hypothetical protein [Mucilaginibacter pankratovii]MBD1365136.1 hypothetical protein [Mucilaginibacter pankratovii]
MANKKEITEELLTSFHQQFSENQNHLQTVFIQFLSAVLVILAGYGYVYANTASNADFFNVTVFPKTTTLQSYAILHLLGSFLIAEIILGLLITLILNIGYGFRRDQMVIFNIRQEYLGDVFHLRIFGNKSFDPRNKSIYVFLPEFNRMFVYAMALIQLLLLGSLIFALHKASLYYFGEYWYISLFICLPLVWTFWVYGTYWRKYKKVCCTAASTII